MGGHGVECETISDKGYLLLLCWLFLCSPYQMLACAGSQQNFHVNDFHTKPHSTKTIMSTERSTWSMETSFGAFISNQNCTQTKSFATSLGVWYWTNWGQGWFDHPLKPLSGWNKNQAQNAQYIAPHCNFPSKNCHFLLQNAKILACPLDMSHFHNIVVQQRPWRH